MAEHNKKQEEVKYNFKADTSEAIRSLKELERQVDKLGDMADQGHRRKGGFLSTKQVDMYKRILKEMGKAQEEHYGKLSEMEKAYGSRFERNEFKKLRDLENNLKKRSEMVRRAEGGNKWGDTASPAVQEFHRHKQKEAHEDLKKYQGSSELKGAVQDTKKLEAELTKMSGVMEDFSQQMNRGGVHSTRMNELRELNPTTNRAIDGASSALAGAGVITGMGGYAQYTMQGIDSLRQQELSASGIAQKIGYEGANGDARHRESVQPVGVANQYDIAETLMLQGALARGGTTDADKLNKDTKAIQGFSRAYAVDPNSMAEGGSLLRKMGAMEEGQMDKLAQLIGGQVSKNKLSGREEEVNRATIALASSVSQGMDKMSTKQLGNLVGLQTDVGSIKGLEGERGSAMLSNMDSAIKGSNSNFDLLLGKGTEFTGLEGMVELGYQKEQGIANPKNIQRILQNSEKMFGKHDGAMTESALAENGFMTQHEFRALKEAGILDKWKDGDFDTQKEVEKLGLEGISKKTAQWNDSQSKQFMDNQAKNANLKSDHAKTAEEVATGSNTAWNSLPDVAQHAILPMTMLGGLLLRKPLTKAIKKKFSPKVGDLPGTRPPSGMLDEFGKPMKMADEVVPNPGMLDKLKGWGGNAVESSKAMGGKLLGDTGGLLTKGVPTIAKRIPVVGSLLGTGIDQAVNPENSWGKSIAKGVGGTIGGILGIAGAGALGVGTGGAGFLAAGAMGMGGAVAGEKSGEWLYDLFSGEKSGKKEKDKEVSMKEDPMLGDTSKEKVVRIILEGDIKGMDKKNQDAVSSSITSYFEGIVSPYSANNGQFRYNLALDQTRG